MNKTNKNIYIENTTKKNEFFNIDKIKCINKCDDYFIINPITFNISLCDNNKHFCSIFPYEYTTFYSPKKIHLTDVNNKLNYNIMEIKKCNKKSDFKTKNNYTTPIIEMITEKIWLKIDYNIDSFDAAIDVITNKYIHNSVYYYLVERIMNYSLKLYYKQLFLLDTKSSNVFLYIIKNKWIPNIIKNNINFKIDLILKNILSHDFISNFIVNFIQLNNNKIKKINNILYFMEKEYYDNILLIIEK